MSTEHAVDPSTLDLRTRIAAAIHTPHHSAITAVQSCQTACWQRADAVLAVLADECPPAEQWRRVTPEDVRNGWLVRLTKGDQALEGRAEYGMLMVDDVVRDLTWRVNHGWTLWTNEPPDPDPDADAKVLAVLGEVCCGDDPAVVRRSLAELRDRGFDVVEVDRGE